MAIENAPRVVGKALKESGYKYGDMDFILPHQTSKRAIKAGSDHLIEVLGEAPEMFNNLTNYANTASTTHFIAMTRLLKERVFKKGQNIMLMVFASGLVIGVVMFTMDDLVDKYGSSS